MRDRALTWTFRRRPALWAVAVLVVVALGLALDAALLAGAFERVRVDELPDDFRHGFWTFPFTAVPYALAGALLIARRPDLPFGWLLGGAAVGLSVALAGITAGNLAVLDGRTSWWVATLLMAFSVFAFLPIAVQGLINVRFPSGRPHGRPGRVLDRLLVLGTVGVMLGGVLGGDPADVQLPGTAPLRGPFAGTWLADVGAVTEICAPVVVLLGLVAGLGVVVRWRRAQGLERRQLAWRAWGVLLSLALFVPAVLGAIAWADYVDSGVFVATLVIPVLRYRLWDVGTVVRRSTAYAMTSALLVAAFAAVSVLAAEVASRRFAVSLGAVAVAFAAPPAWNVSHDLVNRAFYGSRADPSRALRDVARRLDDAAAGGVLGSVVEAVASTLRLPYVAITRPDGDEVLAATGTPPGDVEGWDLTYRGTTVGRLIASPRRGDDGFDDRDRSVIADIARQAGPAVQAEVLTVDLLRARQRLVTAREDDRRRLRRDLHDGLGPALTGLGLTLDAARAALAQSPAKTEELLDQAKDATAQLISDLRQTVYDLRPPVLDELGLAGAVGVLAQRLSADGRLRVEVVTDGLSDPSDLPAAVEVAAYRAAIEAVTNVVRHTTAATCRVRLETCPGDPDELVVDVRDDGSPGAEAWPAGVGLTAMRERAEELGGTLTARPTATGGEVVARYPLVGAR